VKFFRQAEEKFQTGEVTESIELLEKAIENDDKFFLAHFALADVYYASKNIDKQIQHLEMGLSINSEAYPKGHYFLAKVFYDIGEYHKAKKYIDIYASLLNDFKDNEKRLKQSCDFAVHSFENPVSFTPKNLGEGVNSELDEYWPMINAERNRLVFTRLMETDIQGNKLRFPQEDFYTSEIVENNFTYAVPIGKPVNTNGNEGAQCLSPDGRLLLFTACNRKDGVGRCDIYFSVLKDSKWTSPINLGMPVNSSDWESQPSVSADGSVLYFVSSRKGGKGNKDIWKAEKIGISKEGYPVYSNVKNVEEVNTPGNETSPFIHADGKTLYFSSDYLPGMGKNDLFYSKLEGESFSNPVNLGYPINTLNNEEGLFVDVTGNCAYYNSSMEGFGGRDIFSFELPTELRPTPVSYVKGRVRDANTGKSLSVDVVLNNLSVKNKSINISRYENSGDFLVCLTAGDNYGLSVEQEGYLFYSMNFNLTDEFSSLEPYLLDVELQPIEEGKATVLNNVFFETDSYKLKEESFRQLNEVVKFMKINSSMIVEIGGHTDNIGTENYNKTLSEKRAASVVNYLKDNDISEGRLKYKGYGFSKPVADNLTEEGRGINRRTEFLIIKN
jgi:outer membrane protein OmpA-like peptidoglycan-associated protein/tetratricopeptide (TPR) repeat protein